MAARKNTAHSQRSRDKIKTTQLINRLNSIALGDITVDPTQLRAIEVALRKSLPDLQSIEHTGETDSTLTIKWAK